jgi:S1-C subfamily serine protease
MALADIVARVRSGLFQIAFANANNAKTGGGSAFLVKDDLLVTNHHVFMGYQNAQQVGVRRDDMPPDHFVLSPAQTFAARLVTGSEKNSYDYAVLKMPEVVRDTDHRFVLEPPGARRIGDAIALLGFPLEHSNLTCHQGIISSFYQSGLADVIQIDASVNAGNSGGPLIDPQTGAAIGIVTRKATGLSALFEQLRNSLDANIQLAQAAVGAGGGIIISGVSLLEAFSVSQTQMLATLSEIERQANVGIGYAFSAAHVLQEPSLQDA